MIGYRAENRPLLPHVLHLRIALPFEWWISAYKCLLVRDYMLWLFQRPRLYDDTVGKGIQRLYEDKIVM